MDIPKPFLKWAGGKRKLASQILSLAGPISGDYYEPFLGAGAVYFAVGPLQKKFINDANSELINAYQALKQEPETVIEHLGTFRAEKQFFLEIRSMDRDENFGSLPSSFRAARFIYLNKVGYNGLHRVNSKGHFNVPYGRNTGNFLDASNLLDVSKYLNAKVGRFAGTKITNSDFVQATNTASLGDFVYLDPPYAPLSDSSNFVSYAKLGFDLSDQIRVRDLFFDLAKRGVTVIASNSDTEFIRKIYKSRSADLIPISVSRPINSNASGRGAVPELLIRSK